MKKANELAEKEENKETIYVVRGYPNKWKIEKRIRHTKSLQFKIKVEERNNIGCRNITLKLINIQGLTKKLNLGS